jgi:thiol-disulfide isomerase/thioredoxin
MSRFANAATQRASRFFLLAFLLAPPAMAADVATWKGGATPPLELKDLSGTTRTLDQWRGKVIVVNFWATWCEPCIEEMPSLQRLGERHADRGLAVMGVNLAEGEARIRSFLAKTGVDMTILLDRDALAKNAWKVRGVPATYVIGRDGKIRFTIVGQVDFADPAIEKRITALLGKPARAGKR